MIQHVPSIGRATVATAIEAKRDTLTILIATAPVADLELSPELAEACWIDDLGELSAAPVSRWLRLALDQAASK